MKNLFKRILTILILAIVVNCSLVVSSYAYNGGNSGGAGDGGGTSGGHAYSCWPFSCFGKPSWFYFKTTGGSGIITISTPYGTQTIGLSDVDCHDYGGFYVLMRYGYMNNPNTGYTTVGADIMGPSNLSLARDGANYITGDQSPAGFANHAGWNVAGIEYVTMGEPWETVHGYFEGLSEQAKHGQTWDSSSNLGWFCYGDRGGQIKSRSGVNYQGDAHQMSAFNSTVIRTVGITGSSQTVNVGFRHVIAVPEEIKDNSHTINWQVVNGDANGANANSSFGTRSGGFMIKTPPATYTASDLDGSMLETQVFTVNASVTVHNGTKICQTIKYTPATITADNNNSTGEVTYTMTGSGQSTACIVFQGGSTITENPDSCASGGFGYLSTIHNGTSGAYAAIVNRTADQSGQGYGSRWLYAGSNGETKSIWARPGDTISFSHCLAVGAQYVRYDTSYSGDNPDYYMNDASGSDNNHKGLTSTGFEKTWFQITSNKGSSFAFGNRNIVQGSPQVQLKKFTSGYYSSNPVAVNGAYNYGGLLNANILGRNLPGTNAQFIVFSPSTTNNGNYNDPGYSCEVYDFAARYWKPGVNLNTSSWGWQIQGLRSGSGCSSAGRTGTASVVGQTVKQTITFLNVRAWTTNYRTNSGSCSCNPDSSDFSFVNHDDLLSYTTQSVGERNPNESGCDSTTCVPCISYKYWSGSVVGCNTWTSGHKYRSTNLWYKTKTDTVTENRSVEVKIPYNFETQVSSSISNSNVVYLGETMTSSFSWKIKSRYNADTKGTYATITPSDTEVQMVEFITDVSDLGGYGQLGDNHNAGTASSLCSYYSHYGSYCTLIGSYSGALNGHGLYAGASYQTGNITTIVPDDNDALVGMKYCVAVGINYDSSHVNAGQKGLGGIQKRWHVSGISCRTIAKKPNFQVWNAGTYSSASVLTSISNKFAGVGFGYHLDTSSNGISASGDDGLSFGYRDSGSKSNSARTYYGSWDEYEIISNDQVTGIASASALGNSGLSYSSVQSHGKYCRLAYMTIANKDHCNSSSGYAGEAANRIDASTFLSRFQARYKPSSPTYNVHNVAHGYIDNNTEYYASSRDINLSTLMSRMGDGGVGNALVRDGGDKQTLVIYVDGALTIDRNICEGYGSCTNWNSNLNLRERNTSTYSSISELRQVIVIANDIYITENVTQVDAWLTTIVIGESEHGRVNTCWLSNPDNYNSNVCNKTLIINGPVFTDQLLLNRTAGALTNVPTGQVNNYTILGQNGSNTGSSVLRSMTPAEIFNFRSDNIFWMYNQLQNYSEAQVTYTRELAPRF